MLTDGQRQVRDLVRRFAQTELAPTVAERDRTPRFPREAFDRMADLGLLGMTVPAEWGGAGADYVSYALAVMEIAAIDGATSTAFQVHNSLVCLGILRHGTAAQKERYLRALARGEMLGAFCLSEPGAGSDAAAITTRAHPVTRSCGSSIRWGSALPITARLPSRIARCCPTRCWARKDED